LSDFNDSCNFSTDYDKSSQQQKSILWEPSDAGKQMSRQTDRQTDMALLTVTVLSFVNKLDNSNVYE